AGDIWSHNRANVLVMNRTDDKHPSGEAPSTPAVARQQIKAPSISTASRPAKPRASQGVVPAEGCAVCLPVDPKQENQIPSPYTVDFFDVPWQGRFHWNWHQTGYTTVRSQGTLKKNPISGRSAGSLLLQLDYDSQYTDVCVGDLREIGRSVRGYIIHFKVEQPTGQRCDPRVTHAYLYPFGFEGEVNALLHLVLYRDSQLISSGLMKPPENSSVELRVEPEIASQARAAVEGLKAVAANDLRVKKRAAFKASADYNEIAPLYEACMGYQPDIFAVIKREPYCQCVSEKVGIGKKITDVPVDQFVKDFASLVARLHGQSNNDNKFYFRIGESCRHCSDERYELEPYCSGPDTLLYAATDYQKFIRLLERDAPEIEATDYYKKVFYRTYLQGYSAFCGDRIQDPVPFVRTVTETTIGGWDHGNVNIIQRDETLVEHRYAEKYGRFYDEINAPPSGGVDIGQAVSNAAAGASYQGIRRQISDAQAILETQRANRAAVSAHLQQGCDARPVVESYARLFHVVD
ncbi:MAG: hypothetical protein V2I41_07565, partial [Pseudomonadales bacterium]|nr:hypothetical protein [Pseudomonadales bacterium]